MSVASIGNINLDGGSNEVPGGFQGGSSVPIDSPVHCQPVFSALIGPGPTMSCSDWLRWFIVLLRQQSYIIKNQRKARNAPNRGHFELKMPNIRSISCLSPVLYGTRVPIIDPYCALKPPLCQKKTPKGKKSP